MFSLLAWPLVQCQQKVWGKLCFKIARVVKVTHKVATGLCLLYLAITLLLEIAKTRPYGTRQRIKIHWGLKATVATSISTGER